MSIRTRRLLPSEEEPHTLEVLGPAQGASLLLHLERLPGLEVVAKKAWVLTDDFEAYFLYRERLFVMWSPMSRLWVTLLGSPADEALFTDLETHVQRFSFWRSLFSLPASLRYLLLPLDPPPELLRRHGVWAGGAGGTNRVEGH
jgi:hypothetical protein